MINTTNNLLEKYRNTKQPWNPKKIIFDNVGNKDVYNITAPFNLNEQIVIAGRVESRDSEESEVYFFVKEEEKWQLVKNMKKYKLQDPFITKIQGQLVFGGVETFPHPDNPNNLWWRTVFYKGENLNDLEVFAMGPNGMKDIRLIELPDNKIGVFTRPQGEKGGRGRIGFFQIDKLEELTVEKIDTAPLLEGQFVEDEWGGVNEAHLLINGSIGVLGHIAQFDEMGNRHYYSMEFCLNPHTMEHTEINIIAERSNMVVSGAKRPDLVDVLFSGGIIRQQDGTAILYTGVSDIEAQKIIIMDPFLKYEK